MKKIFIVFMIVVAIVTAKDSGVQSSSGDSYSETDTTSCVSSTQNVYEENISTQAIADGIELLEETLLFYEHNLVNDIGEPFALEGNVYYFHTQTLFERSGIMSLEIVHGDVVRTTWTCEFSDGINNGEDFYNEVLKVAATMPYQNLSVNRTCESGVPQVSITVWSDAYQTTPMPDSVFGEEELLGKWVDSTDPDNIEGIEFYKENNQLMYRYYSILPGNSIGMNTANEVTEWDYCEGIVTVMANQGNIYCHRGEGEEIAVSFYYGFDGSNVMYKQEDGSAYYRE